MPAERVASALLSAISIVLSAISIIVAGLALRFSVWAFSQQRKFEQTNAIRDFLVRAEQTVREFAVRFAQYLERPLLMYFLDDPGLREVVQGLDRLRPEMYTWSGHSFYPALDHVYEAWDALRQRFRQWRRAPNRNDGTHQEDLRRAAREVQEAATDFLETAARELGRPAAVEESMREPGPENEN